MKGILRNSLAVIAGIVVGSLVNMGLIMAGSVIVPPPPGVDPMNAESLAAAMDQFGPLNFLFPFLAHALGTLAGATLAFILAGSRAQLLAWIIGVFFLAGGIAASFMIPAPAWFIATDLLLAYLPMAWLAGVIGRRLRARQG